MAKEDKIVVVMEGGVIQEVHFGENVPSEISVIIRDFDIDGVPGDELFTTPIGEKCLESEWFYDGTVQKISDELGI